MANNSDRSELQDQVRNIAGILVGIFKDKKMTIDEQIDLGILRLNEASVALLHLKRAKRNESQKTGPEK